MSVLDPFKKSKNGFQTRDNHESSENDRLRTWRDKHIWQSSHQSTEVSYDQSNDHHSFYDRHQSKSLRHQLLANTSNFEPAHHYQNHHQQQKPESAYFMWNQHYRKDSNR